MNTKHPKIITFGEIMMRLSTSNHYRLSQITSLDVNYGGSEANVAVSLANFGVDVSFVSRIPENELSGSIVQILKKLDVNVSQMVYGGDRLGTYYLEVGVSNRNSKVIYDRKYSSFYEIEEEHIDWDEVFKNATWFHWSGVTPAISMNAARVCRRAILEASKKGLTISTDLNMRHKLWNWGKLPSQVMPELVAYTHVLFGDMAAFKTMLELPANYVELTTEGIEVHQTSDTITKLKARFPKLEKIILSFRNTENTNENLYAAQLFSDDHVSQSSVYKITNIVDRIGTGDAFVGGVIYGLNSFDDDAKSLEFGVAAASLKHSIRGDFNLVTKEEVFQSMNTNKRTNVSR
ncbi:2-dehydro-3-deoxygluconokinase [Zhouia amylolytica]|uniref:2-dehydro-3-deoxygluconokinase n=1 Tax=Zhouia amylolytica TaxID=376730 RepID=A0A1I6RV91_9FLAO|nr:sugar kinase [Zhouia amylolytica]SFS68627.1 2-dehydro-3-deoxygluconokinase [Zhouia amylolytica]